MSGWLRAIAQDTSGASATEYGVLLAFVSFAIIASASQVGNGMLAVFTKVNNTTSNAFASSAA